MIEQINPSDIKPAYPGVRYVDMPEVFSSIDDYLLVAEARANSLKHSFQSEQSAYGEEYRNCIDHPLLAHHGQNHCRPVEIFLVKGIRSYTESNPEFLESPTILASLSAAALYPYGHDLDQLSGSYRNLTREEHLKEKKGHALGAAVQHLAMTSRYAQENDISYAEAYEITSLSAIMMMRHDEPEKFNKTFADTNEKAYQITETGERVLLDVEQLRSHYENDSLDLFSLSPSQCIELLRDIKGDFGFLSSDERDLSIIGLSPAFEKEFAEDLAELSKVYTPLAEHISPQQREEVKLLTRLCNWADMAHMISPYTYQFMRTFQTSYSMNRPFSIFHPGSEVTVEQAINMVMTKGGNELPADDLRLAWEMIQSALNEEFANVPGIHEFTKEHTVMSALCLRKMGGRIMAEEMKCIGEIYDKRGHNFDAKYAERQTKGYEYNGVYDHPRQAIEKERMEVLLSLLAPKKRQAYSDHDIEKHGQFMDEIIMWLLDWYKVTSEELAVYFDRVDKWQLAPTQPFTTDSLPYKRLKRMKPQGYTNGNGAPNGHTVII